MATHILWADVGMEVYTTFEHWSIGHLYYFHFSMNTFIWQVKMNME